MKRLFLFFAALSSLSLLSTGVSATGTHTLRVSPSISDLKVDPGASLEKRITAVNKGDVPFTVKVSVSPYSVINEKYQATFEPLPGRTPVDKWFSVITPEESKTQPGGVYDISYKITVPASTPPGGYSAVVFVESTVDKASGSGIVAKNKIAHIVYITVNGPVERKGTVELSPLPFLLFSDEQKLEYLAKNQGGTNEQARVSTVVYDLFGRQVLSSNFDRYVLPGTKRSIHTDWMPGGVLGIYKIERSSSFAGTTTPKNTQWSVIINPVFAVIAVLLVVGLVWLKYARTRTIKARNAKK